MRALEEVLEGQKEGQGRATEVRMSEENGVKSRERSPVRWMKVERSCTGYDSLASIHNKSSPTCIAIPWFFKFCNVLPPCMPKFVRMNGWNLTGTGVCMLC